MLLEEEVSRIPGLGEPERQTKLRRKSRLQSQLRPGVIRFLDRRRSTLLLHDGLHELLELLVDVAVADDRPDEELIEGPTDQEGVPGRCGQVGDPGIDFVLKVLLELDDLLLQIDGGGADYCFRGRTRRLCRL